MEDRKQTQQFKDNLQIIKSLFVQGRYGHAARKARELVENQDAPKGLRRQARWYLLLASVHADLKGEPCFHQALQDKMRNALERLLHQDQTPDLPWTTQEWDSCLHKSQAAHALKALLLAFATARSGRETLQQLRESAQAAHSPWHDRAQRYVQDTQRLLDDMAPLAQELLTWQKHGFVFHDDDPLAFYQHLQQERKSTTEAIQRLRTLETLLSRLRRAHNRVQEKLQELAQLEQELSPLLSPHPPGSAPDAPTALPQVEAWLNRYGNALDALQQASESARQLHHQVTQGHHDLERFAPPIPNWANELLRSSPNETDATTTAPALDARLHLLHHLKQLHAKIKAGAFQEADELAEEYARSPLTWPPLDPLLAWYRQAAREGLLALRRLEDILRSARQALDAGNLPAAQRHLHELRELRSRTPWPLPELLLERFAGLEARYGELQHRRHLVEAWLEQGRYHDVLEELKDFDQREHPWLQEARGQQAFFELVRKIEAGLTPPAPTTPDRAEKCAAMTNEAFTVAQRLPDRPAVHDALDKLLGRWTEWLRQTTSYEAFRAAARALKGAQLPTTERAEPFARLLASALTDIDALREVETALTSDTERLPWHAWNRLRQRLDNLLERHGGCAASKDHARTLRRRLEQALQDALRARRQDIQRLLDRGRLQDARNRANRLWDEVVADVTDEQSFVDALEHRRLPGWPYPIAEELRQLKALRDAILWLVRAEHRQQRALQALSSQSSTDEVIRALDDLERLWHEPQRYRPERPTTWFSELAGRRRELRLVKRFLEHIRDLERLQAATGQDRFRACQRHLRALADALEQYRIEAHDQEIQSLVLDHVLPRAHAQLHSIIDEFSREWKRAQDNIASGTSALQGWESLLFLWQWFPHLADRCYALGISTPFTRDELHNTVHKLAKIYLDRLQGRLFSIAGPEELDHLAGEVDEVRLLVARHPDAARLSVPLHTTTLLDALSRVHGTLRRLLEVPHETDPLHTYLSALKEEFRSLGWHHKPFDETLDALLQAADRVHTLPNFSLPRDDADDANIVTLLDRLIELEGHPVIQRWRSQQNRQNRSLEWPHALRLLGLKPPPSPDHLPLAWWFQIAADPLVKRICELVKLYESAQDHLEKNVKHILVGLSKESAEESEKSAQLLKNIFWNHLMTDSDTGSSFSIEAAHSLSQIITQLLTDNTDWNTEEKSKILKTLIKITGIQPR